MKMEKQIKIVIEGGAIQHVTTNFEGYYQIIDRDFIIEENIISDIYQPDEMLLDQDIFESK